MITLLGEGEREKVGPRQVGGSLRMWPWGSSPFSRAFLCLLGALPVN